MLYQSLPYYRILILWQNRGVIRKSYDISIRFKVLLIYNSSTCAADKSVQKKKKTKGKEIIQHEKIF